jgi:hypothetical protein
LAHADPNDSFNIRDYQPAFDAALYGLNLAACLRPLWVELRPPRADGG